MAVVLLRFVAAYSIFDTLNLILSSALRGAGDTVYVMMLSTSLSFSLMVIPTWVIQHYRIGGIYLAWLFLSLYVCVLGFAFLFRFLRGKWKSMRVIETEHIILIGNAPHAEIPACDGEIC